jgi:C4-dicarboxylate-specific signal transduction histidine kinase
MRRIKEPGAQRLSMRSVMELDRVRLAAVLGPGLAHDVSNFFGCLTLEHGSLEIQLATLEAELMIRFQRDAARTVGECRASVAVMGEALNIIAGLLTQYREISRGDATHGRASLLVAAQKAVQLSGPLTLGTVVAIAPTLPLGVDVEAPPSVVVSALVNLILNASEASGRGASHDHAVQLCLGRSGDDAFCDITDHGPGVSSDVLPRLFEVFASTKRTGHGSGIGLAASRMALRQLGGDLSLLSTSPHGTTFRLSLPVCSAELALAHPGEPLNA